MDFVALDFETANFRPDSPCQVAIAVVVGGQIVDEKSWLIRPKSMYFSDRCIAIHGIRPEHVESHPEWDHIWDELHPMIDGRVLLAHNAGFDINVMVRTLTLYDLACPPIYYSCTRLIARRAWPGCDGYGLKAIAERLQIRFRHHDALEDARTCALVALHAANQIRVNSLDELDERLGLIRGRVQLGSVRPPRTINRSKHNGAFAGISAAFGSTGFPNRSALIRERRFVLDSYVRTCGESLPLQGWKLVLHGTLFGLDRADSEDFLRQLGADIHRKISLQTNFVVIGCGGDNDADSGTTVVAEEPSLFPSKFDGQMVRVLSQRQLLALLPSGRSLAKSLVGDTSANPNESGD